MSDTPRTDALLDNWDSYNLPSALMAEFRELERELNVANNWVEHHQNHCDDLIKDNVVLRNEIARLNNQTNWVCKCGGTDCAGQKENARLREALAFYADPHSYGLNGGNFQRVASDRGMKARAALRKEEQP